MSKIQEKAKTHNELAFLRVLAHKDEERKDRDDLVSQLENKMARQAQMKVAALKRARTYNQRVQEKLSNYNKELSEDKETR